MPIKPKYFMQPAYFSSTDYGIRRGGEGIVFNYEKGNSIVGNKIGYFVLAKSMLDHKYIFDKREQYLTVSQARNNIDTREKFSRGFKKNLLEIIFSNSKYTKNVEDFIKKMLENNKQDLFNSEDPR